MTDSLVTRARVLSAPVDGRLSVELLDPGACRGCSCGRLTSRPARAVDIELAEFPPLRAGDELTITMPALTVLRGSVCLHGLPWAAFLAGAVAGRAAGAGDLGCLAAAAGGLLAALALLRRTRHRWTRAAGAAVELAKVE